jgi:5-hydroxyisourate hydrolase-like protein (transthyretin family)
MRKLISNPESPKGVLLGILVALLVAFCLLTESTPALAARNADTNGQISGQLLDATNANAPLPGQSVTLQMAQGSNSHDLATVTTDAQGSFSFSNLSTDKTINYAVFTRYQGAQYLSSVITLNNNPTQQVNLTVYEATQSADKLAIVNATALFHEPDIPNKTITVSEAFSFKNLDTHTYVGALNAEQKSKPNALLFSLPADVKNINLQQGFAGYNVIQVDRGFATDAALLPGNSDFAFSFDMPYTASTYDFSYETFLPTVSLSFFVPPDIHASSQVLASQGIVNNRDDNERPYNLLTATALPSQKKVDLHLEGLLTQLPSGSATSFNPLLVWLIMAGLVILATLGIVWFVVGSRQGQAQGAAPTSAKNARGQGQAQGITSMDSKDARGKESSAKRSPQKGAADSAKNPAASTTKDREQALLDALLKLDQDYEAGRLSKEVYEERRGKTKARLRSILSEKESSIH